ncbi:unnamed protein product, partial [Ectocarpus sp. 13 AM-2016]
TLLDPECFRQSSWSAAWSTEPFEAIQGRRLSRVHSSSKSRTVAFINLELSPRQERHPPCTDTSLWSCKCLPRSLVASILASLSHV